MIFKRLRNIWDLGLYKPTTNARMEVNGKPILVLEADVDLGDGKAEFLGDGTQEEFLDQQRADEGSKGWYDRLKRLGKTNETDSTATDGNAAP